MKCPLCQKTTDSAFKPFCSKRCADIDLGQWVSGKYAIPSEEPLDEQAIDQIMDALEIPQQ